MDPDLLKQVGLQAVHSSVQEKLTAATTRTHSSSTSQLSDVLLIDSSGWFTTGTEHDLTGLLTAAREQRRIRLRYRRSGEPRGNWITVDPYGLVNKANSWYLVADDTKSPACSTPLASKTTNFSQISPHCDRATTCGRFGRIC
ncbi:hypothetical protein CJ199_06425 [Brevibacterium paucivorans]|uniref:WYL domain-containing protein n=1 Tax=Brevibacterium paucivorans TaxID=170994 RepID=A0A2N6VNN0_9MICO|nr:hypothetical protein CJ199_06425 [Brevibacterium paucivorans]